MCGQGTARGSCSFFNHQKPKLNPAAPAAHKGALHMPNRPKKSKLLPPKEKFTTEDLLRQGVSRVPGEEDFWAFSLVCDDPRLPSDWEQRRNYVGSFDQCVALISADFDQLSKLGIPKNGVRFELYQGDGARKFLSWSLSPSSVQEEKRYQQERTRIQASN